MNDLFLFIENCTLYNYADDNSMSFSSTTLQTAFSNLRFGCINCYWLVKSKRHESQSEQIPIHDFVTQCRRWHWIESSWRHNRLPIDVWWSRKCLLPLIKAARQLNALSRISKYLDTKSKTNILSNFEYCPLVWHFCGKTNNKIPQKRLMKDRFTYSMTHLN